MHTAVRRPPSFRRRLFVAGVVWCVVAVCAFAFVAWRHGVNDNYRDLLNVKGRAIVDAGAYDQIPDTVVSLYDRPVTSDILWWLYGALPPVFLSVADGDYSAEDMSRALEWTANWEYIFLRNSDVDDAAFEQLAVCKSVKMLAVMRTCVSGRALKAIEGWSRLENLCLSDTTFDDSDLTVLLSCTRLKFLTIEGPSAKASTLEIVSQLPALEALSISQCRNIAPDPVAFGPMRGLKSIQLNTQQAQPDVLAVLRRNCPNIRIYIYEYEPDVLFPIPMTPQAEANLSSPVASTVY